MNLATRLSALPTNKLLTGTGVSAIATAARTEVMAPAASMLVGSGMPALIGAAGALLIAYVVPDRVNVPNWPHARPCLAPAFPK